MTTYKLTANSPDQITQLHREFVGWHFSASTIADAFQGMNTAYFAGWKPVASIIDGTGDLTTTPPTMPTWKVQFVKENIMGVHVDDPDWICFDGQFVFGLADADVAENYTVTAQPG